MYPRQLNGANSEYLESSFVIPAVPLTFSCWARVPDTASSHILMFMGEGSVTLDGWYMNLGSSGTLGVATMQAGVVSFASSAQSYVANQWQHCCGVYGPGNDNRIAYLNGRGGTAETTARNVNAQRSWIGRYQNAGTSLYFTGEICEVAIWRAVLSPGEISKLAQGTTADQIRIGSLAAYWCPLGVPEMGNGALLNYALTSPQVNSMRPMTANSMRMGATMPFLARQRPRAIFRPNAFPGIFLPSAYGTIL